jgi:ketosteroid isomerase-like protein
MDSISIVERGYEAVAAGDRDTLQELFADDAVWNLMDGSEVSQTFEGKQAVVEFLLGIRDLRLEAIMSHGGRVVAAHSFASRSGDRVITTTVYELSDDLVRKSECADVLRGRHGRRRSITANETGIDERPRYE